MTEDEIKAEIAAGHIGALTLDTSAFGRPSEMSLEHGLTARLSQFKGTGIRFVLSDVVLSEVEAHMVKGAGDSLSKFEQSLKAMGGSWNISREKRAEARKVLIGEQSPIELSRRRVDAFITATGCIIIKAEEHATIGELVSRYFQNDAPFSDRESKKNEFPDALALMSLNAWAAANNTKILVVSDDDDWVRYCANTERLIVIRKLAEGLSLFNSNAEVASSSLSLMLTGGMKANWWKEIERAVQSHVDSMWFMVEADSMFYFEDEITEVFVKHVDITGDGNVFTPVEMDEESLVAELTVFVELEVTCDFSFTVKDSIDKDYVPMGTATVTRSETMDINLLVTFSGVIPDEAEIEQIEVEGSNRHYVSFGEIEPDWMSDPSNYEE